MKVYESAENYLETILMLKQKLGMVRSVDVAHALDFTKPSVSVAMKNLRESGHITVDPQGFIALTPLGESVAQAVYQRHTVLSRCLQLLGVDEATAAQDACRIEHVISQQSFEKIYDYMQRHQTGPS